MLYLFRDFVFNLSLPHVLFCHSCRESAHAIKQSSSGVLSRSALAEDKEQM